MFRVQEEKKIRFSAMTGLFLNILLLIAVSITLNREKYEFDYLSSVDIHDVITR